MDKLYKNSVIILTLALQYVTCWVHTSNSRQYGVYNARITKQLNMADDRSLFDQLQKTFGEKEDIFSEAEAEKQKQVLMQGLKESESDSNLRVNKQLLDWLDTNGVWIKTESAWGKAPHPLVISSQTEDDGEVCGRGLLARESISEGEQLMTIPYELCLTRITSQEILGKAIVPDYMDEYISIALLLMSEKVKGSASKWKPYLDILPTKEDVYPSFIWSEEELDMLKGSPCYFASMSLRYIAYIKTTHYL